MDRTGWIVIIACSLGLFLWFDGQKKSIEEQRKLTEQNQQSSQVANPESTGEGKEKKRLRMVQSLNLSKNSY